MPIDSQELENAAHEERCWVRLTRLCNNRCLFCLDSGAQDGTLVSGEEILESMESGRRRNATRLILSGGEPTIHPDFLEFIRKGRSFGYTWIQAITNGRMLAYETFTKDAVAAGLSEVTLSLPAHEPLLFDKLVGVKGAFVQALAGLRNALAETDLVVSVDIVLNRLNIRRLPDIMRFYLKEGVREFDLLQIVPFGRAYDASHPEGGPLIYDPSEEVHYLHQALKIADRPDVVLWTNRLEPSCLEGFERLIQDPHKISDEVRGRKESLMRYVRGHELECRSPARCRLCFLKSYCLHLGAVRDRLITNRSFEDKSDGERSVEDRPDKAKLKSKPSANIETCSNEQTPDADDGVWIRVASQEDVDRFFSIKRESPEFGRRAKIWVRAQDSEAGLELIKKINARSANENKAPLALAPIGKRSGDQKKEVFYALELNPPLGSDSKIDKCISDYNDVADDVDEEVADNVEFECIKEVVETGKLGDFPIKKLILHTAETLSAALSGREMNTQVSVGLNKYTADFLVKLRKEDQSTANKKKTALSVFLEERLRLSNSLELDVDPRTVFCPKTENSGLVAQGIPPCLSCEAPAERAPVVFDVSILSSEGWIDPQSFVDFHIRRGYCVYGVRCGMCVHREICPGAPIQMIRNFGFSILVPRLR